MPAEPSRRWTPDEDAAAVRAYNASGIGEAMRALPGRSQRAIDYRIRLLRRRGEAVVRRSQYKGALLAGR